MEKQLKPFDYIGGHEILDRLVDQLYTNVANHPDLSQVFPEDLTETARKQKQFLTQFLGGPPLYTEEHGHPMLRAKHLPFPVTPQRAEYWLDCMARAMDEVGLEGPARDDFFRRLTLAAHHMVNTDDE
ncbi:globin [Bacillus piscicola]|uniref:globin domain-containing protein n=1 Tax=Bacillus piscicola TaxID=1632684 RepID=UPI001F088E04|nr:globin [Bacillus piscicola]